MIPLLLLLDRLLVGVAAAADADATASAGATAAVAGGWEHAHRTEVSLGSAARRILSGRYLLPCEPGFYPLVEHVSRSLAAAEGLLARANRRVGAGRWKAGFREG